MSPKRGDRVAPPPGKNDFDVRYHRKEAVDGWQELCQQAPGPTADAWQEMRTRPAPQPETGRHHQLKGKLAFAERNGETLPQWQIEVTGGGRVWYLFDEGRRTCWLKMAGTGHPKATD